MTRGCAPAWSLVTSSPPLWWPLPLGQCGVQRRFQDVISINMTNTMRCRYNAVKFLRNPHNRHSICPPVSVGYGVSLVSTISDVYSVPATLSMFTMSCYIGARCGGTRLYIICVESDYTCAQMNQGWRPIHVDIHISLTFYLCSMPNLIYEYYAASLLYRAKLYVIRIIFIIFHICATPISRATLNRNGLFTMFYMFICFSYFVQTLCINVWLEAFF